jgi:hypothetical protein
LNRGNHPLLQFALDLNGKVCPDEKTVYIANEFSYRFDKVILDDVERSSR